MRLRGGDASGGQIGEDFAADAPYIGDGGDGTGD
jgi:hypothetical protein